LVSSAISRPAPTQPSSNTPGEPAIRILGELRISVYF
jgi:hypothetical protein